MLCKVRDKLKEVFGYVCLLLGRELLDEGFCVKTLFTRGISKTLEKLELLEYISN